jgi:hypothetical protein
MRSGYIDWLLEQSWRGDNTGTLAKWVIAEKDFSPVEFHDILERTTDEDIKQYAIDSLIEFASQIVDEGKIIKIIEDVEVDKERLNNAVKYENYEEAARLRDRLDAVKMHQSNCLHDKGYVTNDGPSKCVLCGKPWVS